MRKVTSSPEGAGAGASLHRGGAAARGAPAPKAPSSAGTAQRRYACAGDLRESSRAAEEEGEDGPHTVAPCRGAAPPRRPHRPPRLERAPAGQAPGELPAAVGRRGELILRVGGPRRGAGCSGLSRAPEGRPRMPEPRPDPVLGHSLVEALRGLPEARRAERGEEVQLVHAVTVLVVGVVDGLLQRDPRLVLLGAVVQAPSLGLARVGRERERGHSTKPRMCAQFRMHTLHTNNQVTPVRHPFFVTTFEKVQAVLVSWERPLWWASLYSRALTTICVDEVPAPRSRPTTVRQGNGGLLWRFALQSAASTFSRW
jgi:hypothetical protein